jgi:hypothetical protein
MGRGGYVEYSSQKIEVIKKELLSLTISTSENVYYLLESHAKCQSLESEKV